MHRKIKTWPFAVLGVVLLGGLNPAHSDEKKPVGAPFTGFPLDRYQQMIDKSPFAVATQSATPPPVNDAGFTKDYVLTGVVRMNEREYITISTRDQSERFSLLSGDTYNGISLASVAWSDAVGKTKVTLKRGSEYGVVGFDEAAARNGASGPVPGGNNPPANNGTTTLPAGVNPPTPNAGNPPPDRPALRRRIIQTAPQ